MESEKVKEIKYYLEQSACMYGNMQKQALTLINELESENERLLNKKWDCQDDLDNYHEENKQLKDRIAELEHKCDDCAGCTQWKCDCANIEMHAVEHFAERLKEKAIRQQEFIGELAIDDVEYVKTQDIDKTLKECIK